MIWNQTRAEQERQSPAVRQHRTPNPIDLSEQIEANEPLFVGLYEGEYPGLKGASAIAYSLVSVPLGFMGLPTPSSKDERTQLLLNEIGAEAQLAFSELLGKHMAVGRWWIWPNWDAKNGRVFYELIPNSSVTVFLHVETREIMQVVTDEQFTVRTGDTTTGIIRRRREFTPEKVKVTYTGDTSQMGKLISKEARNPSGIMPVPFNTPNSKSVFGRVLFHLKGYHDVVVKWIQTLTKFNVKQVQTVSNVTEWLANNGYASLADVDVETQDVVIQKEGEKTEYTFPESAMTDAFKALLEILYQNVIEGSDVSELHGGLNAQGNHASVDTVKENLAMSVQRMRNQVNDQFHLVYAAALRLKMGATMSASSPDFTMGWNDLEILSEEQKAKLFTDFAGAVDKLMSRAAITMEQLHKMFLAAFPKSTEIDFATWFEQMNVAAKYKQFAEASYTDALDAAGRGEFDGVEPAKAKGA